jgi:hypothetical protein
MTGEFCGAFGLNGIQFLVKGDQDAGCRISNPMCFRLLLTAEARWERQCRVREDPCDISLNLWTAAAKI